MNKKQWYEVLFENYAENYDRESFTQGPIESNERYYLPSEITWLLESLGYRRIEFFGAKLGAFSKNDRLTAEDFEMLVIAEKQF